MTAPDRSRSAGFGVVGAREPAVPGAGRRVETTAYFANAGPTTRCQISTRQVNERFTTGREILSISLYYTRPSKSGRGISRQTFARFTSPALGAGANTTNRTASANAPRLSTGVGPSDGQVVRWSDGHFVYLAI